MGRLHSIPFGLGRTFGRNVSPVPPGSPFVWYDAQDVNFGSAQPADGAQVATWKNKGTLGTAADLLQATAGSRPLFRLIATPGKIGGLSAIEGNGSRYMRVATFTTQAQPTLIAIVFRATNLTAAQIVYDGGSGSNRNSLYFINGTGVLHAYAGADATLAQSIVAATWETCVTAYNGTSGYNRLNGSQAAGNDGTQGLGGITMWADITPGTMMTGMVAEFLGYAGTLPLATDVEAYLAAKYGATPQ